jgi:hypothetical protein
LCNTTAPGNSAGCTVFNAPVALPTLLATPVPGDYNGDTFVTVADYTKWRADFGSTTILSADGNGNGVVDAGDYVFWRNVFIAGGGSASAIPEPGSVVLFLIAMLTSALLPVRPRR